MHNLDTTLWGIYHVWPILFKSAYEFSAVKSAPPVRYKGTLRSSTSKLMSINPLFSSYYTLYGYCKYHGVLLSIIKCRWASNSVFISSCLCKWTIYRWTWWYEKSICCRECDLLQIQLATFLQWEINMIYLGSLLHKTFAKPKWRRNRP